MKIFIGLYGLREFYIDIDRNSNNNMLFVGMPGTAKSTLVKSILLRLSSSSENIDIIDFTGEYSLLKNYGYNELIPGKNIFINPLDMPKHISRDLLFHFIRHVYGRDVTPIQLSIIYDYIDSRDLKEMIKRIMEIRETVTDSGWRNAYSAVLNRIRPLAELDAISHTTTIPRGRNIINLAYMPGELAKQFFCFTFLHYLYYLSIEGRYSAILIIDEAEKIAYNLSRFGERNIVTKIMDELRKYGLYVFLISHSLQSLDPEVINSCSKIFVFRLRHPDEVEMAARMLSLSSRKIRQIPNYYCFYNDYRGTFIVKIVPEKEVLVRFKPSRIEYFDEFEEARKILIDEEKDEWAIELLSNPRILREIYDFYKGKVTSIKYMDRRYYKQTSGGIRLTKLAEKTCKKLDEKIMKLRKIEKYNY